jgi:hypothetical protein
VGPPRAVLVGVLAACLAACGASSSIATRSVGSTPPPSGASSTAITVTTATDCQATPEGFGPLSWWTLGTADSGNTYRMSRCQAIGVELLHSAPDGCRWGTVQTTDSSVLTLLPLPLPGPPPGGTFEVYAAISSGQAMLTSTLSCPGGSAEQAWSVTVDVAG